MLEVRTAGQGDVADISVVHVRSWQVGYRGLLPDEYLDGLRPEDRARHYTFGADGSPGPTTVVAVEDGVIRGFATTGRSGHADVGESGELLALYVDPDAWGRGIGRLLIAEARAELQRNGFAEAVLWVLVGNDRAVRFYRADRWQADGGRRRAQVWGVAVDETRYRCLLG